MLKVGDTVKVKRNVVVMPNAVGIITELFTTSCKVELDEAPFPVFYKLSEIEKVVK